MKTVYKLLAAIIITGILAGCAPAPEKAGSVRLLITGNYGAEQVFNREVDLSAGQTVMDVLQQNLDIETGYGGGFVSAINGLGRGTGSEEGGKDWFYYVNGVLAAEGASDYLPDAGDVIWWDYHDWDNSFFVPAVTGCFPQPFVSGYGGGNPGVLVLTPGECGALGRQVCELLVGLGVGEVQSMPYEEDLITNREKITVVVAPWPLLSESEYWQQLIQLRERAGWFVELKPGEFSSMDGAGKVVKNYRAGTGAVLATANGLGDRTPLWLITALDVQTLGDTVRALVENWESLNRTFGVLVVDGKMVSLPASGDGGRR